MGAESFFIKILPKGLKIENKDGFSHIVGIDKTLHRNWEEDFKNSNFKILKSERYYILNDCLDINVCENDEKSTYIDVMGCFSCFYLSLEEIQFFIHYLCKLVGDNIMIVVPDKEFIYYDANDKNLIENIKHVNLKRYEYFKELFPEADFIVPPSRFFKEYHSIIGGIKRKVKKVFGI